MLAKSLLIACAALAPVLSAGAAQADARTFAVQAGESRIQFVSDAPLERFTGTSDQVSGFIKTDPEKAGKVTKAEIKVEVASIKTGLKLRDEHLRGDDWLDAKRHPAAKFVLKRVEGVTQLKPNQSVEATVHGKFTIHGVTRDIKAPMKVRLIQKEGKPDSLRVVGSFTINLEAHKVSVPSIVALKVAPDIEVNIDISAVAK